MDYFRQFILLPNDQAYISHINFSNMSELREFGKLIFKKLRELDKEIEEERKNGNIEFDLAKPITKVIEQMEEPPLKPEAFISYMIRKYGDYFLLADPTNMKKVMDLLEKNYIKDKWNVILQPNRHKEIQLGLLLADLVHLEKVLNVFGKYLKKDDIIYIIIHKFTDISMIKEDKTEL